MKAHHLNLFASLSAYVAKACEERDEGHGLPHMVLVTENALALFFMLLAKEGSAAVATALSKNDAANATTAEGDVSISRPFTASSLSLASLKERLDNAYEIAAKVPKMAAYVAKAPPAEGENADDNARVDTPIAPNALWDELFAFYASSSSSSQNVAGDETNACDGGDSSASASLRLLATNPTAAPYSPRTAEAFYAALAAVITVAMLHDVNDHKYEKPDGSLSAGLQAFVEGTLCDSNKEKEEEEGKDTNNNLINGNNGFAKLLFPSESYLLPIHGSPSHQHHHTNLSLCARRCEAIMRTVSAISFSKEKRQGMRYFVPLLGLHWSCVRDIVSDADKLEAIGAGGVLRCWHYSMEVREGAMGGRAACRSALAADSALRDAIRKELHNDVVVHTEEKLGILKDQYIVTVAGKALAATAHDEMYALLAVWEKEGPPQL